MIRSSLRPLRTLRIAWDTVFDRIDEWVAEKLAGTRPEDVVPPPPNLAGGVVTGLVFVQEEPDLRDLFVRLLATSMLRTERSHAHPAFAEFIKQMTPLEARIVRWVAKQSSILKLDLRGHDQKKVPEPARIEPPPIEKPSFGRSYGTDSLLAAFQTPLPPPGEHPAPAPAVAMSQMNDGQLEEQLDNPPYEAWVDETTLTELDLHPDFAAETLLMPALENLERLQLIKISTELSNPSDTAGYIKIAKSARAQAFIRKQESKKRVPGLHAGLVLTTSLGQEFFRACVGDEGGRLTGR